MGLYDYKGKMPIAEVQKRALEILNNPKETSPDVMNRIVADRDGPGCVGMGNHKKIDLSIKFAAKETERQHGLKKDQEMAGVLNGFVDEKTGKLSNERLAASGLSADAQRTLRDAHNTASSITEAARATGRLSDTALEQNHNRTLLNLSRNNAELMQFAQAQTTPTHAQRPEIAQPQVAVASLEL